MGGERPRPPPQRCRSGPLAGRTLRQLLDADAAALLGPGAATGASFPWLVKFLDAHDWLSVQVHPDEQRPSATLWPREGSKTEAWFILDAAPGSRIYAGLLPGVGPAELLAAVRAGTVTECLHSFEPRPGDCLFLPAGTVHAVGGGVLMAEVQQTSDATFRLFDWDRKRRHGEVARPLHLAESLACIDWQRGPVGSGAGRHGRTRGAGDRGPAQALVDVPISLWSSCRSTSRSLAAAVAASRPRWCCRARPLGRRRGFAGWPDVGAARRRCRPSSAGPSSPWPCWG